MGNGGRLVPHDLIALLIKACDGSMQSMGKSYEIKSLARGAMFGAITAVLAHISFPVPFSPVPVSGQSFGAMLAGLLLSPKAAAASQLVYLLAGAVGLPVYAGGHAGIGVLLGPTGGYLWGMAAGAYVSSWIVKMHISKGNGLTWQKCAIASAIGGVAVVYIFGVVQLSLATQMPLPRAFVVGALPYLPGDLLKAAFAGTLGNSLATYRI